MAEITCFFLEPTDRERRYLRRYGRHGDDCPFGYHNAKVFLDEAPDTGEPIGDDWPHDDPCWPAMCEHCPYVFTDDDPWQLFRDAVYRRTDTGEETTLRDARPGAMWYADWMRMKGPDGHSLVVKCPPEPGRDWCVDYKSRTGGHWTRTGTPPNVTASPSIGILGKDGEPWIYHGWLRDGKLVDA